MSPRVTEPVNLPHKDERVVLLEDHHVFDPESAALLMRAMIAECTRNAQGDPALRVHVVALTFARTQLILHARLYGDDRARAKKLREARVVFGAVAREALRRAHGG